MTLIKLVLTSEEVARANAIFTRIIDAGFYSPIYMREGEITSMGNTSKYMCNSVRMAYEKKVISADEFAFAQAAISKVILSLQDAISLDIGGSTLTTTVTGYVDFILAREDNSFSESYTYAFTCRMELWQDIGNIQKHMDKQVRIARALSI